MSTRCFPPVVGGAAGQGGPYEMSAKTVTPLPKMEWGDGPWVRENDRVEWRENGLPCLILRNQMGAWCGYVAVPPGHPWHGAHPLDVPADVHGGISYCATCTARICHVPAPGESDDVWWVGFACVHASDFLPALAVLIPPAFRSREALRYRTEQFAADQVRQLAMQARDAWVADDPKTPPTGFYAFPKGKA